MSSLQDNIKNGAHASCLEVQEYATELLAEADKRIEALESALRLAEQYIHLTDCYGTGECYSKDVLDIINKALESNNE